MDNQTINHIFTYHAPKPGQPEKYQAIRDKAKELALLINELCPSHQTDLAGHEKSTAMAKLEECVMWANAAIARNS